MRSRDGEREARAGLACKPGHCTFRHESSSLSGSKESKHSQQSMSMSEPLKVCFKINALGLSISQRAIVHAALNLPS